MAQNVYTDFPASWQNGKEQIYQVKPTRANKKIKGVCIADDQYTGTSVK